MNRSINPFEEVLPKARELVAQMTLEEKADICSGSDFWHTQGLDRLGVPAVMITGGPNGLRKQVEGTDHLGLNSPVPATCFPTAAATACSFDRELLWEMGQAIGEECLAEDVGMILGPAANIKRSPLCGRNFEYFSEDPLLSGESAAALIQGIQSKGVGASMKHYVANNQEKARLTSDSIVDERALREIYLAGFERAVKEAQPWTLMCSYNQINGIYASEHKRLMSDIPRDEWGFDGFIVTDWGAMNNPVEAIRAGVDLEMPGAGRVSGRKLTDAVRSGALEESALDACAVRVTAFALLADRGQQEALRQAKAQGQQEAQCVYDKADHDELAGRIAKESAVLLKRGGALPADKTQKIAVIGAFAKTPRYQGAGSGKINPNQVTGLCDALDARGIAYTYAEGYDAEQETADGALMEQAVLTAREADVVFVCVGLPDRYESEGFDRTHLNIPENQNALVETLARANSHVVAVVSTGGAVVLPWREQVDSILLMYLGGQNGGSAAADLLFGDAVPCGKLAETWPESLEDTPCFLSFGRGGNVEYRESIYVGYRYYDKAGKAVQYPFGYGLSYTDFAYSGLAADRERTGDGDILTVSLTVTNTGAYAGSEIVQIYVASPESTVFKPVRELRDYGKVFLQPGESRTLTFRLDARAFAFYNTETDGWFVEKGVYRIEAGASSRDIRLSCQVEAEDTQPGGMPDYRKTAPVYYAPGKGGFDVPQEQFEAVLGRTVVPWRPVRPFTRNSTLSELQTCEMGRQVVAQLEAGLSQAFGGAGDLQAMIQAMLGDMPLRQLSMMGQGMFGPEQLDLLLAQLNGQPE